MTTAPNEFLQFAKEMGLEQMKPTTTTNTNGYSSTGLSVLNNLCYLIEQIHTLKRENDHLRAHLELVKQVENFFTQRTAQNQDENQTMTLSPSNSLKIKHERSATLSSSSNRERQGVDFVNNSDESPSMIHLEPDAIEGLSNTSSWNRVRHALRFSLRRKPNGPMNSSLTVPAISISMDSDDDRSQENVNLKKKKNENYDETDHDDESIELSRLSEKRESYRGNPANSSSNELNVPLITTVTDEENISSTKQSKIAHYRRKLRSKLSTVRKQFSEQNSSLSLRRDCSTFDDFNHALLTAKLAPAMTKSYQQKMRDWQSLQKSHFLVNYRRQSIATKSGLPLNLIAPINIEESNQISTKTTSEFEKTLSYITPILSSHQRSLIVHQWREIMSEEILLRFYNRYFQRKLQELKQLEANLKLLKTNIFCTKNQRDLIRQRSMSNLEPYEYDRENSILRRCQSLQTLVSMPTSWILAVESAAYSDILDGTSAQTTDRSIIFNRQFFNQLNHFKTNRINFERDTFENFKTPHFHERISNLKHSIRLCSKNRHKISSISPKEFLFPTPLTSRQMLASKLEIKSHNDLLNISDTESILPTSSSATTLNKRLRRSHFDLKKTLQRSKSMCMTQFHSWLQRRRQQQQQQQQQQQLDVPRRKSAVESKSSKEYLSSPSSTPKFLPSPRLARIHQRIFKHHPSSPSSPAPSAVPPPPLVSVTDFPCSTSPRPLPQIADDSDRSFKKQESPVRIYLPARPSSINRHVRISNNQITNPVPVPLPPMPKITSPIINRRNLSTTVQERRESFVASSSLITNQ